MKMAIPNHAYTSLNPLFFIFSKSILLINDIIGKL